MKKQQEAVTFQTGKFTVTLTLQPCSPTHHPELLRIQLSRNDLAGDNFICEIDQNQVQSNAQLSFFERPSNLFAEMVAVQRDIKVTDSGQITFQVSLGLNSKYLITLHALSTRRSLQSINYETQQIAELRSFSETYDRYAEKALRILAKQVQLRRLSEEIPLKRKYGYQLELEKYLQAKQLRYCGEIAEGIKRAEESDQHL